MSIPCRPPILIHNVLPDPERVRAWVERHSPYAPVQRYFGGDAEYRASAGSSAQADAPMFIAPVFRGDWAYDVPLVDDIEPIFQHAEFAEAASKMFDSECVRPFSVYSNLTWQLPFDQGGGHIDIPEFRGVSRTDFPTWIITAMGHSGLFEEERIQIATTVAWFYEGDDGGFTYWPDGPDAPPKIHEGGIFNTAIVGDNDRMFHRVRPLGRREDGLSSNLTLDSRLTHLGGDEWSIVDGKRSVAEFSYSELRVSISWKARVFRDPSDEARYRDHTDDISIDDALVRIYDDLDRRGIDFSRPQDPLRDQSFVALLNQQYHDEPSVFEETGP